MSSWDDLEKVGRRKLERLARRMHEHLSMSGEERLLRERRKRKQSYRDHLASFVLVNLFLWVFFLVVAHSVIPALITTLGWGIGMGMHTLKHLSWMREHQQDFLAAEAKIRLEGKESALQLLEPVSSSGALAAPAQDPLLIRCEAAADQTRERLNGMGPGEVEALAVVDEGLDRVREMLSKRLEVRVALAEAAPGQLAEERVRLNERIAASRDADARALYRSQLEMLEARAEKITALHNLDERMVAYAESYLAALTNLRMDAARLKTIDLPQGPELAQVMKPVRQIEQQMEGIRSAIQEVARVVGP